jgi:hypothetical protein
MDEKVANSLPSAEQLKAMGITKIFFALEREPFAGGPQKFDMDTVASGTNFSPLYQWVGRMRDAGITVVEDGIDQRKHSF